MSIEVHTLPVEPPTPTGHVIGRWEELQGPQSVEVSVDSKLGEGREFTVELHRVRGPAGRTVQHRDGFWITREGAETLRDALTAALDWPASADGTES